MITSLFKFTSWCFSRKPMNQLSILLLDCLLVIISGMFAVYLCSGKEMFMAQFWYYLAAWACSLVFFVTGMKVLSTYKIAFRYSSYTDVLRAAGAVGIGAVLTYVTWTLLRAFDLLHLALPLKMAFLTLIIALILVCGIRIVTRYFYDATTGRAFIYGANDDAEMLAKAIMAESPMRYTIKGFAAEGDDVRGKTIFGKTVFDAKKHLSKKMSKRRASILFVTPSCIDELRENDRLINRLFKTGVHIMVKDDDAEWNKYNDISLDQMHEADMEELLPHQKVEVDTMLIGAKILGKCVLVTGAAGTIGSELVRQIAKYRPARMILVDQAENAMHDLHYYMQRHHLQMECEVIIDTITNTTRMEQIFRTFTPDYVFHAAGYKRSSTLEKNPSLAIQNNIHCTRILADLSVKYNVQEFVFLSTDWADNPNKVIGLSKRISEIYCQSINRETLTTQFVTTRFGNVIKANSSLLPDISKEIKKGGPVTVPHPDVIRYPMLVTEACQLVLQAFAMSEGGEVYNFDMGRPIRIAALAERIIHLSGKQNIEIMYTGIDDGDKLTGDYLHIGSAIKPTQHSLIKQLIIKEQPYQTVKQNVDDLYKQSFTYNNDALKKRMKECIE